MMRRLIRKNRVLYKMVAKTYRMFHPISSQYEFSLELSSHCNLRCPFCAHEELVSKGLRQEKFMSVEALKSTLDFVEAFPNKPEGFAINPAGLGEPFLHPRFFEMLQMIRDKFPNPTPIIFATNGILLNENAARKIIDSDLVDGLVVSLRFPNRERYSHGTGDDCYELVEKNIERLFSLRMGNKPAIHVQIFEQEDFPKAQKRWQSFLKSQDKIYIVRCFDLVGFYHKTTPLMSGRCHMPYEVVAVDVDGYVFPCCVALALQRDKELCLGHVSDGVEQVYRNLLQFRVGQPRLKACRFCPMVRLKWWMKT